MTLDNLRCELCALVENVYILRFFLWCAKWRWIWKETCFQMSNVMTFHFRSLNYTWNLLLGVKYRRSRKKAHPPPFNTKRRKTFDGRLEKTLLCWVEVRLAKLSDLLNQVKITQSKFIVKFWPTQHYFLTLLTRQCYHCWQTTLSFAKNSNIRKR